MKRFKTSLFTTLGLVVLAGVASLGYQQGVIAQLGSTPVRVVNLATAPALTRDVDRREPYQAYVLGGGPDGSGDAIVTMPAVPPGKRLVIETVSVTSRAAREMSGPA